MADLKYIMQGFEEKVNFCDEIIALLADYKYKEVYILTAFINDAAVYNLEKALKSTEAKLVFVIGIRNGVTTVQALRRLFELNVEIYTFDTARSDSIFHVKTVWGKGDDEAKIICGSANITTGGLANNIEAGIVLDLSFEEVCDRKLSEEIDGYIEKIIDDYPENVKAIIQMEEIEKLSDQGLLTDEKRKVKRTVGDSRQKDNCSTVITSRFPLVKRKMKFPSSKGKQLEAIYRKINNITIEDRCTEVWRSKKLKKTHLGITNKNTHPKGEMSLGKGKYKEIDQYTYFREKVFGDLKWKINKNGDEISKANFTLIISGINYGVFELEILHKRRGMIAYKQENYVTSIRWGECSRIIRNKALLDKQFVLLKSQKQGDFVIDIE